MAQRYKEDTMLQNALAAKNIQNPKFSKWNGSWYKFLAECVKCTDLGVFELTSSSFSRRFAATSSDVLPRCEENEASLLTMWDRWNLWKHWGRTRWKNVEVYHEDPWRLLCTYGLLIDPGSRWGLPIILGRSGVGAREWAYWGTSSCLVPPRDYEILQLLAVLGTLN